MGTLDINEKVSLLQNTLGQRRVDAVIIGTKSTLPQTSEARIVQCPLEAKDMPYRHDRKLLKEAIEHTLRHI